MRPIYNLAFQKVFQLTELMIAQMIVYLPIEARFTRKALIHHRQSLSASFHIPGDQLKVERIFR